MKTVKVVEIKIFAKPGGEIEECLKEGLELAVREWRNVRLVHNEKEYLIQPNSLINEIKSDCELSRNTKRK